jgi:MYXO-CTERM domain-containing protein
VEQEGGPGTRPLTVTLSGAASLNQTVTSSEIDSVGYTLFSFDFTSTGGNVDLTFTPNDYTPEPNFMLDNVSVTATTPEPSYALLAMLGLLGVALLRRRGNAMLSSTTFRHELEGHHGIACGDRSRRVLQ